MAKSGRSRVPVKLEAAGDTHIGGRTHNEDAILMRPDLSLFLVADGAGGQNAGNVASSLATTTIAHFFEQTQDGADALPRIDGLGLHTSARRLSEAIQEANREILEIAKTSDKHRGMGTTIAGALFDLDHRLLHLAYVGDSRCYRLREGRLEQLTHDHSLINDVLELRPNISDERVKKLPQNVITRALGMMENLRVSVRSHEVSHGDRYLLCSDGLSDNVGDGQILESLALDIGCDEQVALLVSMALEAGASDNVATIIIDCALPHANMKAKASTRPVKKKSRPKMPRVDVRANKDPGVTEESVPEIVLYDRPDTRDSSPLIHVVPEASTTPEVIHALQSVIEEDQVTKEYESPTGAAFSDPTGGEPAIRNKPRAAAARADPTTKVMQTDHAALREAAAKPMPDPTGEDDPPTQVHPRQVASDSGGKPAARAKGKARGKASKAKGKTKPKAGRGALATPRKGASAKVDAAPKAGTGLRGAPRPTMKPSGLQRSKTLARRGASTTRGGTERGGAAANLRRSSDTKVSAPRLNKPDVATGTDNSRTGDTQKPPSGSDAPPPPDSTPGASVLGQIRMPAAGSEADRNTLTGPAPSSKVEISPDADGLPLPPARQPFDTSDFTNDSVPCHACGSIIMRTADLCMYCGAPTGFVRKKK